MNVLAGLNFVIQNVDLDKLKKLLLQVVLLEDMPPILG